MEKYKRYKNKEARKKYLREYQREYMKAYRLRRIKEGRPYQWDARGHLKKLRERALIKLGELKCVNCGCDVYELLEINHKNGGGRKEHAEKSYQKFLYDIIFERVNISDYEITCRLCNTLHYIESILNIKGHCVTWKI
jgi:hypothetical protein